MTNYTNNAIAGSPAMRSPHLGSRRNSLAESVNHVLHFKEEAVITHSIGGRLGGSIRTSMCLKDHILQHDDDDDELTKEETPLLQGKEEEEEHPGLVVWIIPALSCAAAYAFYNIFIKKGSYSIHPILGGVILQFVAAILGTLLMTGIVLLYGAERVLQYDRQGLQWAVCAGFAVGTAEMLSFVVNGMGVDATQSIPVIIGGSVMFGAVMGIVLLHEVLMCHGWSGVAMLVCGIGLVATDPGDKAREGGGDGDTMEAPSLVVWIGPALVCASAYALYNIFIKLGSASINPILGGVILQFVAAMFGTILLLLLSLYEGGTSYLTWDMNGLMWSCCAGLAVGAAEMLSFVVSGLGVPATHSIPVIIGGSTFFGALLGLIMLGETLMLQGWCGVALLTIGIGVVATDPGDKMEGH